MINVTARPPTSDEQAWWRNYHRVTPRARAEGVGWFLLPVMGGIGVGALIEWIAGNAGADIAPWPSLVCAGLGLGLSTAILIYLRRLNRVPADLPSVEEIHVADAALVEAEQMVSEGPLYFVGVGDDTILFLYGQWMNDPHQYADPESPDRFPSSEFRLVREPETGIVLRVEVIGKPIEPTRVLKRGTLSMPPLANGARFKGSLEQLQVALCEADKDHILRPLRRSKGS